MFFFSRQAPTTLLILLTSYATTGVIAVPAAHAPNAFAIYPRNASAANSSTPADPLAISCVDYNACLKECNNPAPDTLVDDAAVSGINAYCSRCMGACNITPPFIKIQESNSASTDGSTGSGGGSK